MAMGCEEVSARMMELLYGELPAEDRAAALAHVEACAACKAELAAFRATRVAARRALDADAPPARAHEAILKAAAAAVAAQRPVEARPAPARPSFWERLRVRWTLPTFATVGAVAVVVLASKVFLEPDKTVELGRRALQSARTEAPTAAETPPPSGQDKDQAELGTKRETATADNARAAEQKAAAPHHHHAALPSAPEPPARASAPGFGGRRRELGGDAVGDGSGLSGAGQGKASGALGRAAPQPMDGAGEGLARADRDEKKAFGPPPAAPAKPAKGEFAPPPPPREQPATAPVASANEKRAFEDDALDKAPPPSRGGGAPAAGTAAAPSPSAHAKAKKTAEPAPAAESARDVPASPPAPAAASSAAADEEAPAAKRGEERPAVESPVARADRLFAEGRWAEAARAYRELLRRDPRNADAARWRQRMMAADRAAAPQPPAATAPPAR